ncbi:nitrate reductase subunit alpha [Edwardsiella ictaluri]|uniref:Nitrate reductase, alpha subunit, putative n=2 Tax=Edwardsiella ictaluri TaxID=67780 RepID=C5BCD6_EDWI9|nr:nitrate reductase subunit alpha [Edwardsiella ictaluri]ACR67499.1 nitrate reductase, alpha subunit, putative [Edwardsiella ictaluri 93-146]AVZ82009.1 nitrate reductase subunit alpha [Edwardsiella ictaluri]EKS7763381.1 nitrate reductase subunit alpha [Edwardsiella ictaluri]EKS7770201.1 nitrate reductase subunit alpha [Edwardsiella ictaluri]EKS7773342.1 nitrate reductase subunit alpha [Edwardsiella ictaluri]
MSTFLKKIRYFTAGKPMAANAHELYLQDSVGWEQSYRSRWQYDKVVRSTHGVNCTGSCSWKIYVKSGLITWETQYTDYPETPIDLPNHEPRGCPRGASYSWYIYSANRIKYPLMRSALRDLWREQKALHPDAVDAWLAILDNPELSQCYKRERGMGGLVRVSWQEANELIAASNIATVKRFGPDRVAGFSPIPAHAMLSFASGSRYLSLIGGTCLSFYDWYCDLPPSSPQTWGEQTDVPESADWYNAQYLVMWGSNVPQTRTPDAHFMTEARYNGTKVVAISADYAENCKFADEWLAPRAGTDSALALALGQVILQQFYLRQPCDYFVRYAKRFTDFPMLVMLSPCSGQENTYQSGRYLRAADLAAWREQPLAQWKTLAFDQGSRQIVIPRGSAGFRWDQGGQWNTVQQDALSGAAIDPLLSLQALDEGEVCVVQPDFSHDNANDRYTYGQVPVHWITTASGECVAVATVFDLMLAHYGLRPRTGEIPAEDAPCSPAWAEAITGVPRQQIIRLAQEFANNARLTHGRSLIIVGAGINHWFHSDMTYRSIINVLMMCGTIGVNGGGWAHYVGQEKLRPLAGWAPVALAGDWQSPARLMNGTSFFYNHTSQWRYENVDAHTLLSPLAERDRFPHSLIDFNVIAERLGWLPSSPQLDRNPLTLAAGAAEGDVRAGVAQALKQGSLRIASEDPDAPGNYPRILFVWRANLLGSSSKGHEYFLKHLLGTRHGVMEQDLQQKGLPLPQQVTWRDSVEGKLDLLVTLDFRMSTTCLYSDVILPSATWYEKEDLSSTDMHPYIHPFTRAIDPMWEARPDWDIFKGIARQFSALCEGHLGKERDVVLTPLLHDSPAELGQACGVSDWKNDPQTFVAGKTAPAIAVVARDYPQTYFKYTHLGPALAAHGNGGKGVHWDTRPEIDSLYARHGSETLDGVGPCANMQDATQALETILTLAPETNGQVADRAWRDLAAKTGQQEIAGLAADKKGVHYRFADIQRQPGRVIASPLWSGIDSDRHAYTAGSLNITHAVPWRTLTGRQQAYQDHAWMQAFGEGFACYKPPLDTQSCRSVREHTANGQPELVLNFGTAHQKWGIHSTYTDNQIMQTLSRGGPLIWISEHDAQRGAIADNDWVELFNGNGAMVARAVVSQRIPAGLALMYHAQERTLNMPLSEVTGKRGGIHNSITRICPNPIHMIGGYAHLSWGYNYYGTIGSNRDETVIIRRLNRVEWD